MNQARIQTNILALVGIAATFIIAYGLDRWVERSRTDAAQTFNFASVIWIMSVANLALAGCLVMLVWLIQRRAGRQPLINTLCVLIGLSMALLPAAGLTGSFPLPFSLATAFAPTSHVSLASAFVAALGVYNLIIRNRVT